ncbi:phage holin family protein [Agromyces aerolatus]|uniref:phage holin family protein n=1 Tax=Agromyces sp. LY-1074 TaxID=3074080 RepID=UPI002857970F|nr:MULTISPECIES: phage holin family protein [unclassified Agromyces]MDR5701219.1 phage holin family protein [Agromyces sp. LY-1074]MDR5706905.1 phage holin family protein [Agromyces sp. LY-1358]
MTDNRPGFEPQTPSERQAERESLGQLLQEVSRDLSTLLRQEVELAKAELKESAKKAGKGAGLFGGAGVAGLLALVFVSIAAWWALGYLIGNAWSALIVAVIWGIVAAVLAMTGKKEIEDIDGAPQTVDTLKEIPDTLKRNEENR